MDQIQFTKVVTLSRALNISHKLIRLDKNLRTKVPEVDHKSNVTVESVFLILIMRGQFFISSESFRF